MDIEISLTCWVISLDDANAFPVDILRSKTVGHLNKAIKKKKENALNHIDTDQLEIWKVSDLAQRAHHYLCSDVAHLQLSKPLWSRDLTRPFGKIGAGHIVPNTDKPDPAEKLSIYFPGPPVEGMVHLVVQMPCSGKYQPYTLSCTAAVSGYTCVACERHLFVSISPWQVTL